MAVERALISVFDKSGIVEFAKRLAALKIEILSTGGRATMLRSAAKNFESVAVVTDPEDFERVAKELESAGDTTLATRLELARKVFATTSRYDGTITMELERLAAASGNISLEARPVLPERVHIALRRQQELRYGENPHQAAALYVSAGRKPEGLAAGKQLQGKELSYNNFVDLEAARSLAAEFSNPAAVIIKHNNPCGAAEQATLRDAYLKALACDPVSAFGGVLAFNRIVDAATAEEVAKLFAECIAAPGFDEKAKAVFAAKKNRRLLELPANGLDPERELQLKRILGGMLIQQPEIGRAHV